ncbi:MAG: hypothetical protein EBZ22_09835, partial [Flavobacteriia bacterium]|nr:hypothetical protein [Flavobacteriia bacterium]
MEGKERQPWHTLLFVVVVLGLFGVLGAVNPKAEWVLSDSLVLRMPMWKPWEDFARDQEAAALAVEDSVREWAVQDSLARTGVETRKKPKPGQGFIQFAPEDSMGFAKMVMALEKVRQGGSARILHFGDSQIEGDRITGDLRDALQRVYGGEGPGMQPLVPFVPMAAVAHTAEGTWTRMV